MKNEIYNKHDRKKMGIKSVDYWWYWVNGAEAMIKGKMEIDILKLKNKLKPQPRVY